MNKELRPLALCCLLIIAALLVVGAVSHGVLRHIVQTSPLWIAIVLASRGSGWNKWAALPCFIFLAAGHDRDLAVLARLGAARQRHVFTNGNRDDFNCWTCFARSDRQRCAHPDRRCSLVRSIALCIRDRLAACGISPQSPAGYRASLILLHQRVSSAMFFAHQLTPENFVNRKPFPPLATFSPAWTEYELLDTGDGRKLERFGPVNLIRPEPQATWSMSLPKKVWDSAYAQYVQPHHAKKGQWNFLQPVPPRWPMRRNHLSFWVEPTPSGHLGVFPDQASHWDWLASLIAAAPAPPKILSLFGYTGLASLACAAAGAHVTHVDASRKAIKRARENQALSQLEDRPIRWLIDDAPTFVAREIRRDHSYDGFILDPPRFGRGPQGELWKVEEGLPGLLRQCRQLLAPSPLFVLLNTYTTVLTRSQTATEAAQLNSFLEEMLRDFPTAVITSGELVLADRASRQISNSVFARAAM